MYNYYNKKTPAVGNGLIYKIYVITRSKVQQYRRLDLHLLVTY